MKSVVVWFKVRYEYYKGLRRLTDTKGYRLVMERGAYKATLIKSHAKYKSLTVHRDVQKAMQCVNLHALIDSSL
jgi:hypothetical protein